MSTELLVAPGILTRLGKAYDMAEVVDARDHCWLVELPRVGASVASAEKGARLGESSCYGG
jgi:hypothetical protein